MMKNEYDVVIIGGGASGMAAAITLKRKCPAWDVAIFEKKDVFLKKVSQTGNGRCNISNVNCPEQDLVRSFFFNRNRKISVFLGISKILF